MSGDDRVRHCSECRRNVYNLSGMTRRDATELVQLAEGRMCVRFYRRKDGTLITQNCPLRRTLKASLASMAGLFVALSILFGGPMIVMNWRYMDVVVDELWKRAPLPTHTMGIMAMPQRQSSNSGFPRDIDRTTDESDDTPPSHERPIAR